MKPSKLTFLKSASLSKMWLGAFKCRTHVPSKIISSSSKQPSGTLRTLLSIIQNFTSPNPTTSSWFRIQQHGCHLQTYLGSPCLSPPTQTHLCCSQSRISLVVWRISTASKQAWLPSKLLAQFQFQKNKVGSHIYLLMLSLDLLFQSNAVLSKV